MTITTSFGDFDYEIDARHGGMLPQAPSKHDDAGEEGERHHDAGRDFGEETGGHRPPSTTAPLATRYPAMASIRASARSSFAV